MNNLHPSILALITAAVVIAPASTEAGGRTTIFRETVEVIVGRGGREVTEKAALESTEQAVETVVRESADARNLVPFVKDIGSAALTLEAKAPGLAQRVVTNFGPEGAGKIALTVPAEDVPRLVGYADRADTPATRQALLEAYEKEGPSLFERIPPTLVFAGGLTGSMVYGTHRVTAPLAALGEQIRRNPHLASRTLDTLAMIGGGILLTITAALMWRLGLFRSREAPRKLP